MRGAGLIKFSESDESRFLGPSSGIAITRFVMELARANTTNRSIHEVVTDKVVQEIKQKTDMESQKPTSKAYAMVSDVAASQLPTEDLVERLVDIYMAKAQYLLPLLHEPSFRQDIQAVFQGSRDPVLNFQLRLVIAISLQRCDIKWAGVADSYYLAALPYLQEVVQRMDVSTLQCFALIAEYSVLTPTRTASYWIVGLATRLCQDLGLCDEKTIVEFQGRHYSILEVDLRRRLYWIITSLEFGLAHILGRPSAFGTSVENINVKWFELCDDRYITSQGLLPGRHPVMKKCMTVHFFKMRLIQAEIRRTLYLKRRDSPLNDEDPWFDEMMGRIDRWVRDRPVNDEGSGVSEIFEGRRGHLVVFLYRPSPQIPEPSVKAALLCYGSSTYIIKLQKYQIQARLVEYTWILTQTMFMALNTILWSLSYPEVRNVHSLEQTQQTCQAAIEGIAMMADRWPGVESARQLYATLVAACLRSYETEQSFVLSSSPSTSPTSTQDVDTPPSLGAVHSPASTAPTSLGGPRSPASRASPCFAGSQPVASRDQNAQQPSEILVPFTSSTTGLPLSYTSAPRQSATTPPTPQRRQSTVIGTSHYSLPSFELGLGGAGLPGSDQSMVGFNAGAPVGSPDYFATFGMDIDDNSASGYWGDNYSQYLQQQYFPGAPQIRSLDQQQQSEMMAALQMDELPDMSAQVSGTSFATYPGYRPELYT